MLVSATQIGLNHLSISPAPSVLVFFLTDVHSAMDDFYIFFQIIDESC